MPPPTAKKSPIPSAREAARKVAAPFWKQVEASRLDRFFLDRLLHALLRRWKDERFARVRQGGLHGETRAELSRVFIDLEATPGDFGDPRKPNKLDRIVASWMRSPKKNAVRRDQLSMPGHDAAPLVPLEVVLGGPGQGKSTVGRFLVRIHSAILLLTAPIEGIVQQADIQQMESLLLRAIHRGGSERWRHRPLSAKGKDHEAGRGSHYLGRRSSEP